MQAGGVPAGSPVNAMQHAPKSLNIVVYVGENTVKIKNLRMRPESSDFLFKKLAVL